MQTLREWFTAPWLQWIALLLLCSAYLQGAWDKLRDFPSAVAEVRHLGLVPAVPLAVMTIAVELAGSLMVLSGWNRWLGALLLAGFTASANLLADRFWTRPGSERRQVANTFFEHWGLVGAFVLVAWIDLGGLHAR